MSEFYGDRESAPSTAPEDDPVGTWRIEPPDTQSRKLNLGTARAVKVDQSHAGQWVRCATPDDPLATFLDNDEVADWPVVHPVTIGAAQLLSRPDARQRSACGHVREVDEGEFPFKSPKVGKQ